LVQRCQGNSESQSKTTPFGGLSAAANGAYHCGYYDLMPCLIRCIISASRDRVRWEGLLFGESGSPSITAARPASPFVTKNIRTDTVTVSK
jgi:hypothetical protein